METKEVAIRCPCCESRITVDVRTRKIVTWHRAGEVDRKGKPIVTKEDWNAAEGKVQNRLAAGEDRFDANLSREKTRGRDLDDLFEKMSEKPDDDEDGSPPT